MIEKVCPFHGIPTPEGRCMRKEFNEETGKWKNVWQFQRIHRRFIGVRSTGFPYLKKMCLLRKRL